MVVDGGDRGPSFGLGAALVRAAAADDERGGEGGMVGWAEVGGVAWRESLAIWSSCFLEDSRAAPFALSWAWVRERTMMAEPSVSACFALMVALAAARESAVCLTSASKSDCFLSSSSSSSSSSVAWRVAVASTSFFTTDSAWSRPALRSAIDILLSSRRISWDICGQR